MWCTKRARVAALAVVNAGLAALVGGCVAPMAPPAAASAPPTDLATACAQTTCRDVIREIRLRDVAGGTFVLTTERIPYAYDGTVSLFPGETVVVDFPESGALDMPRLLRAGGTTGAPAEEPPASGGTVAFEFRQDPGRASMSLMVKSTLSTPVKFDATMFVPTLEGMRPDHTSTCPVIADGDSYETWPHPIAMLVLSNFHTPEEGRIVCE